MDIDFLLSMCLREQPATQNYESEEDEVEPSNATSIHEKGSDVSANGVAVKSEERVGKKNGSVSANGVVANSNESTSKENGSVSANAVAVKSEEDGNVTASRTVVHSKGGRVVSDRLKLVFIVFVLHGMGTLMPWNMFVTAKSYFVDFKLDVKGSGMEENRKHFLTYVCIAAIVPNVLFSALNLFVYLGRETLGIRIITAIIIQVFIFLLTIVLAMVDTTLWVWPFFNITITSVVIINMAGGVYQSSVYGLAAKLPMIYSMAVIFGTNVSGTFTALILLVSIASSPNPRTAAIYYFIMALVVLFACLDTYLVLPLNKFYRYYHKLSKRSEVRIAAEESVKTLPHKQIFRQVWPQCLNAFLIFFVSLTIFPAMCAEVKRVDDGFFINGKYFTPVTCFLSYNLFSMVGSFLPNWFTFPGPKRLWILVVLRFVFIPLFMFCNYIPATRTLPVGIESDEIYSLLVVLLGLSSGYCSSLAMMYAPASVDTKNATVAGMLTSLCLILGVLCGIIFTLAVRWIVENA